MKEYKWKKFFDKNGNCIIKFGLRDEVWISLEELYQIFRARLKEEE